MKKTISILVLLTLASGGVFAQFAITGDLGLIGLGNGSLNLGIRYGLNSLDILASINGTFNLYDYSYNKESNPDSDYSQIYYTIGIYAGIAPKISLGDKWTLSFPLLAQFAYNGVNYDVPKHWPVSPGSANYIGYSSFSIDLKTGARAEYALSDHWGIYTGFIISAVRWTHQKRYTWKTSSQYDGTQYYATTNVWTLFVSGGLQLGISYKF
jgi:hypothetical protein